MVSEHTAGCSFWRLPLPKLEDDLHSDCEWKDCATSSIDFWKLPLSPLDFEDSDEENLPTAIKVLPPTQTPEVCRPATKAAEISEMLRRCKAEREEFERNLKELNDVQARLKALTQRATAQASTRNKDSSRNESKEALQATATNTALPSEVLSAVLWFLEFDSLAHVSRTCSEWCNFTRSEERWLRLLASDWGIPAHHRLLRLTSPKATVTPLGKRTVPLVSIAASPALVAMKSYRQHLNRWHAMRATFCSLKGSGCPSSVCGSLARKRLFEALETLAELGAVPDRTARYPSQIPSLLVEAEISRTLVALLDDESPHMLHLSIHCLADVVVVTEEAQRLLLREEIIRRGTLLRELLEGEDLDVVEALSRLLLNLHGTTSLGSTLRGPLAFLEANSNLLLDAGEVDDVPAVSNEQWASAWSGLWQGEMRYARGGETHAQLRLVLGASDEVERTAASLRREAGEEDATVDVVDESNGTTGDNNRRRPVKAGESAEYWNYFGFLADSDFDCLTETRLYIDEQIRRRHQPSSPSHTGPAKVKTLEEVPKLVGAGWDNQNGFFTAEAILPPIPPRRMFQRRISSSVPLKLSFRYEGSRSTYELTAFLADGSVPSEERNQRAVCLQVPALFGVWATAPSQHKHLFVLKRSDELGNLA